MTDALANPVLGTKSNQEFSDLKTALDRRGLERLDLLLLTVEALDLNGGEAMLWATQQLGFTNLFPNRVELWKRRCTNPLRRSTRRTALTSAETEALIRIVCAMADRLYPMLHQLLSSREPEALTEQRWALVGQRLRDLVAERMNLRRGSVQKLLQDDQGASILRQLVFTLAYPFASPCFVDPGRERRNCCQSMAPPVISIHSSPRPLSRTTTGSSWGPNHSPSCRVISQCTWSRSRPPQSLRSL